ncbi:TPA: tyrosine-type recombinase/integrase [Burkholderia cenocepacia]|uniref:Tyr recombinase domain-containing protein n=2 Tax=Burkholderia cepacia complex TaxID=87882 RepID=A0ABD7LES6_9BURK|nr:MULTISPECIES: tyrosine-type recombinase/integrase [Burkholderia cepacia complex]MBJ9624727.1 tyrosine-type recombinase/integrase [Burkholderia multivorans]MBU9134940.1 tyrosine-type recombinase/integrase [Burkholderia multivorans]MBU9251592.1 tyrosine-type recombinase/integrase [Burkholderia multivorans]MBU9365498.1 tyrosine-type recombinase/integrase [Burkholderia multivorans]MBU9669241.1 tyrosine-type recombinase/integrase [Burkholderia multivorans]
MAGKAKTPGAIPRFRSRKNADGSLRYYYDHGEVDGRRILEPLGTDRVVALQRWAELEGSRAPSSETTQHTFAMLEQAYRIRELPQKSAATQRMYDLFLSRLAAVIGDRELDTLTPADVATIWRATAEKRGVVTANRTKAVLSLVLNCGRLWGMMTIANPCAGVRGKKETGRQNILIDDELYAAVYAVADQPLRNAMDLADLCAQRPSDVLRVQRSNIVRGNLIFRTQKTGAFVTVQITGELAALIERLLAWRGSKVDVSPYLLRDEEGYPLTKGQLRSRFDKARELAGIDKAKFQFRDLRARGVTHKTIDEGLEAGQRLAGHSGPGMTARYVRGARPVKPSR